MFEAAREAMEQASASPQSDVSTATETNDSSSDSSSDSGSSAYAPQENSQEQNSASQTANAPSAVTDLEKLGKFTFKGKEYTASELDGAMMRQQDYTQKTQSLAQERRYADNLRYDLEAVSQNPSMAEQFKQIYPEKYHPYLDMVMSKAQSQNQMQYQQNPQAVQQQAEWKKDPDLLKMKSEFNEWKSFQNQEQQKQAEKTIDTILETMATKLKVTPAMRGVAEEIVISRANLAINQGVPLTQETWEKIYSSAHEALTGLAKDYNKSLISKQQAAGLTARDTAGGGSTPGQAPKRMSFKEATDAAIKEAIGR